MKSALLFVCMAWILTSCASGITGKSYVDTAPEFDIESFFNGQVKAWGIVQDRSGELVQRFKVDIDGSLANEVLTLDETFEYGVGEGVTSRIWKIRPEAGNSWSGTAGDILGEASGEAFGNAFRWSYQMDLPVGDSSYKVAFDDWMWAFDESTIMNRSYITKFGITFAEVTIFMQKQPG